MEHTCKDIRCGKLGEIFTAPAEHCGNVFGRRTHLLNLFTESGAAKIRAYLFPDLPVPAPAVAAAPQSIPNVKQSEHSLFMRFPRFLK